MAGMTTSCATCVCVCLFVMFVNKCKRERVLVGYGAARSVS